MRRKILITGASGMLGRVLCRRFSSENEVVGVSKTGRDKTVACDISVEKEIASLFQTAKPDLVLNAAAYSDVDGCERDPELAYTSNALAVKYLAALCGTRGVPMVHVSTDYVFDGRKHVPYVESDATDPVNIYGLSKLGGEYYAAHAKSPSVIVRTSWLFGPNNPANFVNAILQRLKKDSVVSVLDDQTDAPTYVGDLCLAIEKIAAQLGTAKETQSKPQIYHICNAGSTTRYDMTLEIKKILHLDHVEVVKASRESIRGRLAMRPPYAVMSSRHFETTFGMKLRPWQESLKEYLLN